MSTSPHWAVVYLGLHAGDDTDAGTGPALDSEHPLSLLLLLLAGQDPLLLQHHDLLRYHLAQLLGVELPEQEAQHRRLPLQDGEVDEVDPDLAGEVDGAAAAGVLRSPEQGLTVALS